MRITLFLLFFVTLCNTSHAQDIAICGESKGYAYSSFRGLLEEKEVGWEKDSISDGKFTFRKNNNGELDMLFSGVLGVSSALEEGAKIIPATISDDAITIVVIYPNKLSETYVFQKLKDGNFQAMWTQAKAETPFPRVTAFVSECNYLNLEIVK